MTPLGIKHRRRTIHKQIDWTRDTTKRLSTQYLSLLKADGMKSCSGLFMRLFRSHVGTLPFELFGIQAKLPIDFNAEEDCDPAKKLQQYLCSQYPSEEKNNKKKKADMKKYRNKAETVLWHKTWLFSTGSLVLKNIFSESSDVVANWILRGRVYTRSYHPKPIQVTRIKWTEGGLLLLSTWLSLVFLVLNNYLHVRNILHYQECYRSWNESMDATWKHTIGLFSIIQKQLHFVWEHQLVPLYPASDHRTLHLLPCPHWSY